VYKFDFFDFLQVFDEDYVTLILPIGLSQLQSNWWHHILCHAYRYCLDTCGPCNY